MSSSLGTALASGRSPAYWLREMVQHATWTDTFRYTCAWLPELIALQPVLNNGPLFGGSLALLATDRSQPATASLDSARQGRPKTTRIAETSKAARQFDSNAEKGPHRQGTRYQDPGYRPTVQAGLTDFPGSTQLTQARHVSVKQAQHSNRTAPHWLAEVDRRAEHAVLQRLAGETMPAHATNRPRHRSDVSFSEGQHRRYVVTQPTPAQQSELSLRSWESTLVKRTRHQLRNVHQSTALNTNEAAGLSSQQWNTAGEELLSQQWNAPVTGQSVPVELLLSLSGSPQWERRAAVSSERERTRSISPLEHWVEENETTGGATGKLMQPGSSLVKLPLLDGEIKYGQGMEELFPTNDRAEQIMPPVVASQLPPLVTSQRIDIPPLPVAAATVRLGARAEMIIEDDLDLLAAKIKRILDDEARRHGIDV